MLYLLVKWLLVTKNVFTARGKTMRRMYFGDDLLVNDYFICSSAMREEYGDNAVGYVELKREGSVCTVQCKICPEHKVRAKNYIVVLVVDESKEEILSVECKDCAASAGKY